MVNPGESPLYTVFQFSLETGEGRPPIQRTHARGSFDSVEKAFEAARRLAWQLGGQLNESGETSAPTIIDTEWGYDLRLGPLTVHRFWVHENFSSQRLLK